MGWDSGWDSGSGGSSGARPPGYTIASGSVSSGNITLTATTETTANTLVALPATVFDGTACRFHFYAGFCRIPTAGETLNLALYDGASSIGRMVQVAGAPVGQLMDFPIDFWLPLTPSAGSHTYSMRGYSSSGDAFIVNNVGGLGNFYPMTFEVLKV